MVPVPLAAEAVQTRPVDSVTAEEVHFWTSAPDTPRRMSPLPARYRPEDVSEEKVSPGLPTLPADSRRAASMAPRPLRSRLLVSSVAMSLSVVLAQLLVMRPPSRTGLTDAGREYVPPPLRAASALGA